MFSLGSGETRYGRMVWPPQDTYVGKSLDVYGEFSPLEAWAFQRIVKPTDTVIEVGANIGAHTIQLGRLAKQVIAYEPQKELARITKINCLLNDLDNVTVHNAACGRIGGCQVMMPKLNYSAPNNFGGVDVGEWAKKVGEEFLYPVPMVSLDSEELPGCDVLKVDVEGWEIDVLLGAESLITTLCPTMYVENDRADKGARLIELIRGWGYTPYWHVTPLYAAQNLKANPVNIFKDVMSFNLLCVHPSRKLKVAGVEAVASEPSMEGKPAGREMIVPELVWETS